MWESPDRDKNELYQIKTNMYPHLNQANIKSSDESRSGMLALFAMFFMSLAGCTTIEPDGNIARHYLGYVKVIVPSAVSQTSVYSSDVSVLGVRIGNGAGVGYSRDRQLHVPIDCRLAMLVANQSQLDDAISRLPALLTNLNACVVVTPSIN